MASDPGSSSLFSDLAPRLEERRQRPEAHAAAIQALFARVAPRYDLVNRVLSLGLDARWRRRVVRALDDAPPGAALDLCAGTMDLSRLLARAFPDERVVAVDFSPEMLARGRSKAPRVERVVADALALPFPAATFTRVVCGFGVRNVSDVPRAVREAERVLAPGGVFVTLELFRPSRAVTRAFQATYARAVLPGVGGALSGDRAAYRYLSRSMEGFMERDAYAALLRAAGFDDVRSVDLTGGIASIVSGRRRA